MTAMPPALPRTLVAAAIAGLGALAAAAQTATPAAPETGPAVDIAELPSPSLDGLEQAVAEQLATMHEFVVREISQTETPPERLAEPIGELGRLYLAYELNRPAEQCLRLADRLAPRDFRWPYHLGYLAQQEGRLDEAAELYERSLSIVPSVSPALIRLGQVYAAQNRPAAAEWVLREVLAKDPASAAAEATLGELLLAEGRHAEAVTFLRGALDKSPGADRLYYPLALALRALGQNEAAREALERRGTVGIRPTDPLIDGLSEKALGERVRLLRGRAAYQAGRFEEAAAEFRGALEGKPDSIAALVNLGSTLGRLGDVDGAMASYRKAIELAPGNQTAHLNLGLLLSARGELEQAVSHLESAGKLAPEDGGIRFALAGALRGLGRLEDALIHYRAAAELEPPGEMARFREGQILANLGRYAEARDSLEKALAEQPRSLNLALALARVLARAPDLEVRDGVRALELALQLAGAAPTLRVIETVAMAYAEAGQCGKAAEYQSRALEAALDQDEQELADLLQRMLERYQQGPPCRYPVESPAADPPQGGP